MGAKRTIAGSARWIGFVGVGLTAIGVVAIIAGIVARE